MPPAASLATSLKKGEGEPLDRHDVQYALLEKIFNDERAVFTPRPKSEYDFPGSRIPFGALYVEDFLSSNKLSKTLKEKFQSDMDVTKKVCMASLLVNTGRINTTLVFTPTQARTYNPIPSIQAYGSGHKMLQDAPRLKGILKGSCDRAPSEWETLRAAQQAGAPKPLSNPINLVFLLSSSATHLDVPHFKDYAFLPHELLSDTRFTSDSRARAFLWLMYHYIETDGTKEEAQTNPFGPSPLEFLVPTLEAATEGESLAENVDLPTEVEYSTKMWEERKRYLALSAQKAIEATPSRTTGSNGTPALHRSASGETARDRADSLTPSMLDDTIRRSSRKVKRKTYDSGPESFLDQEEEEEEEEDYKSQRAAQILRHKLRRHQHATKKARRGQSGIQRCYAIGGQDESLVWHDSDGEEARTLAKSIRRAERRAARSLEAKEKRPVETPNMKKASSGGGFKIKLKF